FTPSSVRTYSQLALVEADVFDELQAVGNALGAHGFVNISCIRSEADGRRYYFEADMRPNAWVSSPRHRGDDPAQRIAAYFSEGRTLTHPPSIDPDLPEELAVPCFARVPLWHLAVNRSGIWKTMPEEGLLPIFLCVAELKTKDFFRNTLKPLVPAGLWSWLKACYERAKRKVMG
ncbi:MAG TPA: hypothetical protein VLN73_05920, partial [Alphaproteobacteria bacterium]|nr:hypothetical protein [Alphaproteobacteria bacterium]